ncbi:MAG: TRAP transporter small permease subunit [Longimicrobiales bacterium]|nr:TRAP transporter small permease subunit [Longimicrobiales bacterium]
MLVTRFVAAVDRLNGWIGSLARWLILVMVVIGAWNALARWATRHLGVGLASNALNELQWYLFSIVFLLGAAWALREDAHVRVDVLRERLTHRARAWVDLLGSVLFLLPFSALMIWVSIPTVRNSWRILETSPDPNGLPRYPIKTLLIVAFVLLFLQGSAEAIRAIRRIRAGTELPEDDPHPAPRDLSEPHRREDEG